MKKLNLLYFSEGGEAAAESPEAAATAVPEPEGGASPEEEAPDNAALLSALEAAVDTMALRAKLDEVRDGLRRQAEEMQSDYPGFSLDEALRGDPDFRRLLAAGVSVRRAWAAVRLPELIKEAAGKAAAEAAVTVGRRVLDTAARTGENAVLDRAAAVMKPNVSAMSEREILAVLEKVRRGEKISF